MHFVFRHPNLIETNAEKKNNHYQLAVGDTWPTPHKNGFLCWKRSIKKILTSKISRKAAELHYMTWGLIIQEKKLEKNEVFEKNSPKVVFLKIFTHFELLKKL